MTPKIGKDIGPTTKWIAMTNLRKYGVKQFKNSRVLRITPDGVDYEFTDPKADEPAPQSGHIDADTVVLAIGSRPNAQLYEELAPDFAGNVYNIGDSAKIGKAIDAIAAAYDLAASL